MQAADIAPSPISSSPGCENLHYVCITFCKYHIKERDRGDPAEVRTTVKVTWCNFKYPPPTLPHNNLMGS